MVSPERNVMAFVRITKEFTFEMAHALGGYDGKCNNIHGHSYALSVTVKGRPSTRKNDPKLGMLIDFSDLKDIVNHEIIKPFDHALVIQKNDKRFESISAVTKVLTVPYQPTCENMIIDFVSRLQKYFSEGIKLHSLRLRETATSYAEWYAEDNDQLAQ